VNVQLFEKPRRKSNLFDSLASFGGTRRPFATARRPQERAGLEAGRKLANGLGESLCRKHYGLGYVKAVSHEPCEARCLAPDGARIVATPSLRERFERDEPLSSRPRWR